MPEEEKRPSYLDENVDDAEKQSGQARIPSPEEEGGGEGKEREPEPMNPDRPDEFGDGDRRS